MSQDDRQPAGQARCVVAVPASTEHGGFEHRRVLPGPALSAYVAHYWWVRWDLPAPRAVATLPHPCVHWVVEQSGPGAEPRGELVGIQRRRFERTLAGCGSVFGIKFRPGVYRAFSGAAPHLLVDVRAPLSEHAPAVGRAWLARLSSGFDLARAAALADAELVRGLSALPPEARSTRDLVEELERDQSLVRAEQVARRIGVSMRTLERRFRGHVGVSPKWVIRRYRLIEALEELKRAARGELSALAATLGYSDQAHFTRDFKSLTGMAPGAMVGTADPAHAAADDDAAARDG